MWSTRVCARAAAESGACGRGDPWRPLCGRCLRGALAREALEETAEGRRGLQSCPPKAFRCAGGRGCGDPREGQRSWAGGAACGSGTGVSGRGRARGRTPPWALTSRTKSGAAPSSEAPERGFRLLQARAAGRFCAGPGLRPPGLLVPRRPPGRLAHPNVPPETGQQGPDPTLGGQRGSSASLLFREGPCPTRTGNALWLFTGTLPGFLVPSPPPNPQCLSSTEKYFKRKVEILCRPQCVRPQIPVNRFS